VTLPVDCNDRLYLNGYVPTPRTSGQLCWYLKEHLRNPIPSPTLLCPLHDRFVRDKQSKARQVVAHVMFCDTNRVPLYRALTGRRSDLPQGVNPLLISQVHMPESATHACEWPAVQTRHRYQVSKYERLAYRWNNESDQNSEVKARRDTRFRLPPGTYEVRVYVGGVNAEGTFWLTLTNGGPNKPLQLIASTYRRGIRRLIPRRLPAKPCDHAVSASTRRAA
jgi:hypothetical protein